MAIVSKILMLSATVASVLSASVHINHEITVENLNANIEGVTFQQWCTALNSCSDASSDRQQAFESNKNMILAHNLREAAGQENYKMGLGPFSDLTSTQFKKQWLKPMNRTSTPNEVRLPISQPQISVDWRTKGAVTPVKNQGQCGSCWSFSTTGSTEGAVQIATGKLEPLSEQQLMDCSTAEGDHSCEGGLMDYGFEYIIKNGGIDSEADYPYKMKDEACDAAKEKNIVSKIESFHDVPKSEEAQLIAAIEKGPVAVAIEADQAGFQHYASGIFSGPCGTSLDHGVLAVGYTEEYIIVKNSWGAAWGDEGFILMGRNQQVPNGICGICMSASYPVAAKAPHPPPPPPHPSPPSPPPHPAPHPIGCAAVKAANRTDCGKTLSKAECEAKKCCYDDSRGHYECFHPDFCAAVSPASRKDCGYGLGKAACEAKNCCFDTTHPFTFSCFYKAVPPPTAPPHGF